MSNPAPLSRTKKARWPSFIGGPEVDAGSGNLGRELPRVPEEVLEQSAHQPRIGMRLEMLLNPHLDDARSLRGRELGGGIPSELRKVDQLAPQPAPRDPRQGKQAVDEVGHFLGVEEDLLEPVLRFGVELVLVRVEQHLRESVHSAQRRAQVVGHGVAECLQLTIRGLGRVLRVGQRDLGAALLGDVPRNLRDRPRPAPRDRRTGELVTATSMSRPSLRRRTVSKRFTSPWPTVSRMLASSSSRPGGMRRAMDLPTTSSAA